MKRSIFKIKFILILMQIIFLLPQNLFASKNANVRKKRVAVLSFKGHDVPDSSLRILRNSLELYLFKTKFYDVLEREQVDFLIKERSLFAATGGVEQGDAAKIGALVSADFVVIGSIFKNDDEYSINIKVVGVSKSKILISENSIIDNLKNLSRESVSLAKRIHEKIVNLKYSKDEVAKILNAFEYNVGFFYVKPGGSLKENIDNGYGVSVYGGLNSLLIKNLSIGLNLNYFFLNGDGDKTDHALMLPLLANIGYSFLMYNIIFKPEIGFGVGYNSNVYYPYATGSSTETKSEFQLMSKGGFSLGYLFNEYLVVQFSFSYWNIYEKSNISNFTSSGVSIGLKF